MAEFKKLNLIRELIFLQRKFKKLNISRTGRRKQKENPIAQGKGQKGSI